MVPWGGWAEPGVSSAREELAGVAHVATFSRELGWAGSLHMALVPHLGWLGLTLSTWSLSIHDEVELSTWVPGGLPGLLRPEN